MPDPTLPDLSKDTLVELGGWGVLKEARGLFDAGAVQSVEWEAPLLTGEVRHGGTLLRPQLNLKSLTFAESRCSCLNGRRGIVCAHVIALCLAIRARETAPPARTRAPEPAADPRLKPAKEEPAAIKSIRLSPDGATLRLRLLLPPNLEKTAPRDAIVVKLEVAVGREIKPPESLFRGTAYTLPERHERAYALLEQWCGGKPSTVLQLKRAQLSALLEAMRGEPFIYFVNLPGKPLEWIDGQLPTVHPHLVEAEKPTPAASVVVRRRTPEAPSLPRANESPAVAAMRERMLREGPPGSRVRVDGSTQFLSVTLPDRDHRSYEPALELLKANEFRHEPSNRRWWLRDRHKTLNFLAAHEHTLREELDAVFTENFEQRAAVLRRVGLALDTRKDGAGFSLSLKIEAGSVEPAQIYRAMASGMHYIDAGEHIYLFDPAKLERLAQAQRALSGERGRALTPNFEVRVRPAQLRDAEAVLEELDDELTLPADWTERSGALKRIDRLERPPLPADLDKLLRNYQRIGVAWLWHLHRHQLGGILADEMGLGKTIQALGLITCACQQKTDPKPVLVVCPASLLGNWAREAARFAPQLKVFTHHRERRLSDGADAGQYDLILTSYPTLARDEELLSSVEWNLVIADEAQHIKNRRTQAAVALRRVNAPARFVLTGTPVENSLDDLRSIFAFCLPGYLARMPTGTSGEERQWFDGRHRAQAAPYILRRTKQLVAPELPDKIEQVVYCELGDKQRALYQQVRETSEKAIFELEMAGRSEGQVRMAALTQLLRLRQVCAEPRLLDDALSPTDSTKLEAFLEILEEALDDGHRMLVFSQFVSVLGHLRAYLEEMGLRYCYLDGSTRDRLAVCDTFNNDAGIPVFLISLKAGGVGLNLTGADTVVHFDPWWNPAVENQATDRAHRIGQTRTVTSYKLIAADTVEEKVLDLQRGKAELLRDLLDESAASTAKVSLADIKDLIKR